VERPIAMRVTGTNKIVQRSVRVYFCLDWYGWMGNADGIACVGVSLVISSSGNSELLDGKGEGGGVNMSDTI
jgi:hypothetical protein